MAHLKPTFRLHFTAEMTTGAEQIAEGWLLRGHFAGCDCTFEEADQRALTTAVGHVAFSQLLRSQNIGFAELDSADLGTARSLFAVASPLRPVVNVRTARTALRPKPEWAFGIPEGEVPASADLLAVCCWNPDRRVVDFYGTVSVTTATTRRPVIVNGFTRYPYDSPHLEFYWADLDPRLSTALGVGRV